MNWNNKIILNQKKQSLIKLGAVSKIIKDKIFDSSKDCVNIETVHKIIETEIALHNKTNPNLITLAFPTNINKSKNLAHNVLDSGILTEGIIKIDFGLKSNRHIIDTAISLTYTPQYYELITVLECLFTELDSFLSPRLKIYEVSKFIHQYVTSNGFFVISEMSGHTIGHTELHEKPYIYNFLRDDNQYFYEGQVFTIEPFITYKEDYIVTDEPAKIFKTKFNEYTLIDSKNVTEKYSVLSMDCESAQIEHTYIVLKDRILRLT